MTEDSISLSWGSSPLADSYVVLVSVLQTKMRPLFKDKPISRATQTRVEGTSTTISGLNPGTK